MLNMKRILASALILSLFSMGIVGCGEMSSTKKEKEVKTSGDNPPPAKP
jgi:hypothetical protein